MRKKYYSLVQIKSYKIEFKITNEYVHENIGIGNGYDTIGKRQNWSLWHRKVKNSNINMNNFVFLSQSIRKAFPPFPYSTDFSSAFSHFKGFFYVKRSLSAWWKGMTNYPLRYFESFSTLFQYLGSNLGWQWTFLNSDKDFPLRN